MPQYSRPSSAFATWAETASDNQQPLPAEITAGWPLSTIPPSRQRFNWFFNYVHAAIRYLLQRGTPDWDTSETYAAGARVQYSNQLYVALQASNGQNPSTAPTYWALQGTGFNPLRNRLINGNFAINQRAYVSATNTSGANQYTLDRWRVVTSGQNLAYSASGLGNQITAPAGGVEQVIEAANIEGGSYTLSWTGTATATVNGAAVVNGAQVTLTANTNATVRFLGGTVTNAQLELGSIATPFDFRPFAVEMEFCQRYYQSVYAGWSGSATSGTSYSTHQTVPMPMRAAPTCSVVTNVSNSSFPVGVVGDVTSANVAGITYLITARTASASAVGSWGGVYGLSAEL